MLDLIVKCARKLHISTLIYGVMKPFYHSRIAYDQDEVDKAYRYLSSLSPCPDNSSIHTNHIGEFSYELQIIIPAYNVEKYIEECISSVLSQESDCSYICTIINDGSTDNTRKLLESFEHFPQIEIIDQSNRGFSGARNKGLEQIKGRYVMFLDSDDKLAKGAINALLKSARKTNADIIEGGYSIFNGLQKVTSTFKHRETISNKWFQFLYGYPWGKIYKAELFQNLHFPEKYWFEDTLMSLLIYPMCKKVTTVSDVVYMYRINPSGISATAKRSTKCLDSLWITWRPLKDREILHLSNNEDIARFIIFQFAINFNRIHALSNKQVDKAVFILHIYLYEKYIKLEMKDDFLFRCMEKRDFQAFKLYSMFNK